MKFRFDVVCRALPVGHAVRKPDADVLVPVRFITTAATPVGGTPPWPVTCRSMLVSGASGAWVAPIPERVSRMRAGTSGTNWPPSFAVADRVVAEADVLAGNQPTTSNSTCVSPSKL